ncbi:YciI family protein [Streptomyces sp. PTM05]|uniref:YciI family protein n=1 Tax=Streptantibioticus parmotrematis TaxID=2873249 RepID=A0ABS7QYC0_9ACTN|nr:YciI family protein [Streptantibioticus parmotrematis]MBY8888203.1 YciI family protein [Streptantibioticus parmotrematis]
MRFMSLIRVNENGAPEGGPSPRMMEEMGKLLDEITKAGVMLDTAGLGRPEETVRVRSEHGKLTVTDGPFAESKEFIGGYAIMQTKSKEEAVEWAKRFAAVHDEGWDITCEVRQVEEPPAG